MGNGTQRIRIPASSDDSYRLFERSPFFYQTVTVASRVSGVSKETILEGEYAREIVVENHLLGIYE
ncbi:hypothetical protein [Haladaptatus halobius]|uniref:hypothetical protein n=1 Tax=Haladaptatus halobius TaxID=2884875 RepID=UPI001D0B34DE|nr:hypothetical protein [Haladaptatus halobius]